MAHNETVRALAHEVVEELWDTRENLPFRPTAEIDLVWVVSAPGTVKDEPNAGPYKEQLFNLELVKEGIRIVQEVTALRLGKPVAEVTKDDIEEAGPVLFYNGERAAKGHNYPQNEHLEELVDDPDFPLPRSKVSIEDIEEVNTPGQVKQLAERLAGSPGEVSNIAVVSGFQHSPRVGRYIEQHKGLFSEDVRFLNAAADQHTPNESAIAGVEARKTVRYYGTGHLALKSAFYEGPVQSGRPDLRRAAKK